MLKTLNQPRGPSYRVEGEVHKLFIEKLPWLWFCPWYAVLWAGKGLVFHNVLRYLRPLLCAQIYGNSTFSAIKTVDLHWSYVWGITSQMSLAHAQKPLDFTCMSLYGSWWLPRWDWATICVTTALEAHLKPYLKQCTKIMRLKIGMAKLDREGKEVFTSQTWSWVFLLSLPYKWKVSGEKKGI